MRTPITSPRKRRQQDPTRIQATFAAALWLLLGGSPAVALAASRGDQARGPDQLEGRDATLVVDGMWNALSSIHSGKGRATYSRTYGPPDTHRAESLFQFDCDLGRSRVDMTFTATGQTRVRIDLPKETLLYLVGSRVVERHPPLAEPRADGENPFDARILGIVSFGEIAISNDDMTCRAWDPFRNWLKTFPTPTVNDRGNGVFSITWQMSIPLDDPVADGAKYNLCKRVTLVDSRQQFVPTGTEIWDGFGATPEIVGELYGTTETRWADVGGAMVPVRCVYDVVGVPSKHAEIQLEWESVNARIEPVVFAKESLDLPRGTVIVDTRLGPNIVESVIGSESMRAAPVPAQTGIWRWAITALSVILISVLVVALLVRGRRSRRHES